MENIQRKATKMIPELRNLSSERRLQRFELISLEQRRQRGQLIKTFKYLNGLNNVTLEGLFERDGNVRTRNNGQKLLLRNFKTSQAMNFFPVKIDTTWSQLSENTVSAGTVNTFKNRLDKFWITNPPVLHPTNYVPNSLSTCNTQTSTYNTRRLSQDRKVQFPAVVRGMSRSCRLTCSDDLPSCCYGDQAGQCTHTQPATLNTTTTTTTPSTTTTTTTTPSTTTTTRWCTSLIQA
ncbi:hypothetical protein FHG87_024982 [Trinorchestia longiramus]|nr:hypothetical protein FHG87_024982 [Trinorchestia longiramus]